MGLGETARLIAFLAQERESEILSITIQTKKSAIWWATGCLDIVLTDEVGLVYPDVEKFSCG